CASCRCFVQAGDSIRRATVTGVQTCALPISSEQFNVNLIGPNSRLLTDTRSTGGTVQAAYRADVVRRPNVLLAGVEYVRSDVTRSEERRVGKEGRCETRERHGTERQKDQESA